MSSRLPPKSRARRDHTGGMAVWIGRSDVRRLAQRSMLGSNGLWQLAMTEGKLAHLAN